MKSGSTSLRLLAPLGGAALALALASGCASTEKKEGKKPEAQMLGMEVRGETETEKYDLNGDNKPDVLKIYVLRGSKEDGDKRPRVLARQDLDLDFDGDIDVRRHFNDEGVVVREEMDLDFDGQFDAVDYYADGELYRRDMALNFEGKPTIVKFYTQNKLVRKERDTNGDTKMDNFEYYENGKLMRVGVDRDGDERPDVYTDVPQDAATP